MELYEFRSVIGNRSTSALVGPLAEVRLFLPAAALRGALSGAGFDARLSPDAGLYLCEHVGFTAVGLARRLGIPLAGFVHVPAPAALPVERQRRIPEVILETLLESAPVAREGAAAPPASRWG